MAETYAELEIGLHSTAAGAYQVELRFTDPKSAAQLPPVTGPAPLASEELLELQCDHQGYGVKLAEQLFDDAKVLDFYRHVKTSVQSANLFLRLRLWVDPSVPELQALRWELLHDPETRKPLATSERTLFSRFMVSHDWRPVMLRPKAGLRALIAVAAPSDLAERGLADVDLKGEVARARAALAGIIVAVAGQVEPLTLELIADGLRGGVDVLYLVCHGVLGEKSCEPALYLQRADGTTAIVRGDELADRLAELRQPPRLVVLASCESAGTEQGFDARGEATVQSSLAPRLAEAGVAAVVAMQGKITMRTVEDAMPVFFRELLKDGRIDRALAAARAAVRHRADWWMLVLYLRLKRGRIWYEPGFADGGQSFDRWPAIVAAIKSKRITPVIGSGLDDHVFGDNRETARRLAVVADFPLSPHQLEELPQVAQYYQVSQDKATLRSKVKEILGTAIRERHPSAVRGLDENASLAKLVRTTAEHLWKDEDCDEPHRILARLPCPIYITVNHDDLLSLALERENKKPDVHICRFRKEPLGEPETPLIKRPLVFHMLGHFKVDDSLVLTQDDYFDFLIKVSKDKHVPSKINATIEKSLLFLGFELEDWSFRVLFRHLKCLGGEDFLAENTHVMVQIDPRAEEHIDPERGRRYLAQYLPDQHLSKASIYWGTAADFLRDLSARLDAVTLPTDEDDEDGY